MLASRQLRRPGDYPSGFSANKWFYLCKVSAQASHNFRPILRLRHPWVLFGTNCRRTRLLQRVRAGESVDVESEFNDPGEIRKRRGVNREEFCSCRRLCGEADVGERDRVAVAIAAGGGAFEVRFECDERVPGANPLAPFDAGPWVAGPTCQPRRSLRPLTTSMLLPITDPDGQPAGAKNCRALVIAGDDKDAKARVTHLLDQFGFDTVDAGPLREGVAYPARHPRLGGPRRTAEELGWDLAGGEAVCGSVTPSPPTLESAMRRRLELKAMRLWLRSRRSYRADIYAVCDAITWPRAETNMMSAHSLSASSSWRM